MIFHLTDSERLVYAAALAHWVSVETVDGSRLLGTHIGEQLTGGVRAAYNAVFAMRASGAAIKAGRIERDDDAAHDMFHEFKGAPTPAPRHPDRPELVPNEPGLDWKQLALELLRFALSGPTRHDARIAEIAKIVEGDSTSRQKRDSENLVRMLDMRAASIRGPGLGRDLVDKLRAALGLIP